MVVVDVIHQSGAAWRRIDMERLTNKNLRKACNDPWDYCGLDNVCKRNCFKPTPCKIPKIVDRLAAIEDILGDDYDIDRLRELVQADKDGRCVVLDVKIGQKVWILDAGEYGDDDEAYPLELNINGITLSDEHEIYYFIESPLGMDIDPFSHKDIGKTVFLTREEAEAALRRESNEIR